MNYLTFVGKITESIHICTIFLSKWLENTLPLALGKEHWWNSGVIQKLSYHQQHIVEIKGIISLSELDLSMLLRVFDKNWYSIQRRIFFRYSERAIISRMFIVRNNWAHSPTVPPPFNEIMNDLSSIKDFLILIDTDKEAKKEYEKLLVDVKTNGISDYDVIKTTNKTYETSSQRQERTRIEINSIVRLISDTNTVGIVMGIDKIGDTLRYTVFFNGRTKTYFDGQIELVPQTESSDFDSLIDVQRKLTAHQIKKPSSDSLYSLNAARIDFVPYQFRPALKLIKSDTPRLLIADSVGVGKTIEAGLILKELQARTPLDSILIICPKPLAVERKWEDEMKRFDEDFTSVDGFLLRQIVKDTERDGEWPDKYKRLIIRDSILTEEVLGKPISRKEKGSGLLGLDPAPIFDLVIVDEAHRIRNRNTQKYKVVEYLCNNANAVIFLTATPLQNGDDDLFTLLNLLFPDIVIDKTTFMAMGEPNGYINAAIHNLRISSHENEALEQLEMSLTTEWGRNVIAPNPIYKEVIETLRNNITREQRVKLINDIESLHSFANMINRTRRQDIEDFCVRRPETLESNFTQAQKELYEALLGFVSEILSFIHPTITLKFLMCTLYRQAASCIFGLAPFIRNITAHHLRNLSDEFDEYELDDYNLSDKSNLIDFNMEIFIEKSKKIIELAENLPQDDEKYDKFAELIKKHQRREKNKIIVFTSFRHTIAYLNKRIKEIDGIRVGYVDGSVNDEDRRKLRERFMLSKNDTVALDILLFTEVGSEGLDYQFCDTIVNYDLPWNPMRIEQRIGRIDRRGQESEIAYIYNCVTKETIDEEIYERCLKKIGVFEKSIGDCSEILGKIRKSIDELVLDQKLTEEERSFKLEQLADNEVRRIQEMQRLEDEEKHIFGVDISSFTDDVDKAENPWISSLSLFRLIKGYLIKRLDSDKEFIIDDKLKLTQSDKVILLEDYQKLDKNIQDITWYRYLKSSSNTYRIAFDQSAAKESKSLFITPMHPFVHQAANSYFSDDVSKIIIQTNSSDIAPGQYPFQFYTWKYIGGRSKTVLIPISTSDEVQNELFNILQNAVSFETKKINYESEWTLLAETHLSKWQIEWEKYKKDTESLCRFKIESLTKSFTTRMNLAMQQLKETSDERIKIMREAEITRLENEFNVKKQKLEETAKLADIHTSLLVNGVLIVKEE